ncbi:MAG TPA: hypothetical protein DDX39_08265 [Bacteroidales bacterium]|nr:MAG: hypothetical protein A2W98_09735 [Bacteroidetes bacterium GWF2_33_38]OFY75077.1 MAG: hypothetical protein A2265_06205 [Bacteroidetes bacterium RIFOXYA12_FULL_33_9]HBF88620.1 hypothetical protein [Bacteroidales bacterium]
MNVKSQQIIESQNVLKVVGLFSIFSIIWFGIFEFFLVDIFPLHSIFYVVIVLGIFMYAYKLFSKKIKDDISVHNDNGRFERFLDNLNSNCFYFRHDIDKNFAYISPSIEKVLLCAQKEFNTNTAKYNADKLAINVFEKHKRLHNSGIKLPPYETILFDSKGGIKNFEIREFPVLDDNNEILSIEGIAHDITDYKKVETELKEKENKYQILYESANDAIFIMKGGIFIDCNKKATELLKCSYDQIIMQSPLKFSPGIQADGVDSKSKADAKIKDALKDKPQRFEWQHSKFSGEVFWTEVMLSKFVFMDQHFILALVRDIDSKKKMEQQLSESESKFRSVAETTPTAMFIVQENNFKYMNKAGLEMLGLTIEELAKYSFWDVIYEQDRELVKERGLARQQGEDVPTRYEFRIVNQKTRNIIWLDFSASYFLYQSKPALLGSAFDISDRKRVVTELNKTQKVLINAIEASPDLFTIIDKNHNIQLCNWKDHEYFTETHKQEPKCHKAFFQNEQICENCHAKEVFETGKLKEYEAVNPIDGIKRRIRIYPLLDENNQVESVVEHVQRIK